MPGWSRSKGSATRRRSWPPTRYRWSRAGFPGASAGCLKARASLGADLAAQHAGDVLDLTRPANDARRDHDQELEAVDMIAVLLEQVAEQRNLPQNRHAGLDLVGAVLDQAAEYGGAPRLNDDIGSDIAL